MGQRGPAGRSKAERRLVKDRNKPPAVATVAPVTPTKLACPDWVSPAGQEYWNRIVPVLQAEKMIGERDWSALVNLCEAWSEFQEATRILAEEGRYYDGPNGAKCVHPALKVKATAQRTVNVFLEKFGLQPVTRSRLPAATMEEPADRDNYSTFRSEQ